MDFGLAKAVGEDGASERTGVSLATDPGCNGDGGEVPRASSSGVRPILSSGREQAKGKRCPADRRTDVWAFRLRALRRPDRTLASWDAQSRQTVRTSGDARARCEPDWT